MLRLWLPDAFPNAAEKIYLPYTGWSVYTPPQVHAVMATSHLTDLIYPMRPLALTLRF